MRRRDFSYVRTKRSGTIHAVDPDHPRSLLCGWGNDHRRVPCEYDATHLCFDCNAKLRDLCKTYETPVLRRDGKAPHWRLSKNAMLDLRMEAARKGYWGMLVNQPRGTEGGDTDTATTFGITWDRAGAATTRPKRNHH